MYLTLTKAFEIQNAMEFQLQKLDSKELYLIFKCKLYLLAENDFFLSKSIIFTHKLIGHIYTKLPVQLLWKSKVFTEKENS